MAWLMQSTEVPSVLAVQAPRQGTPLPGADLWWANIIQQYTAPFYDICELLPEDQREAAPSHATLEVVRGCRRRVLCAAE